MKKLMLTVLSVFILSSCSKDEIEVIGVEISDTYALNGTYMLDKTYTKGMRYVNIENETQRVKTAFINDKDMWILIRENVYYYKIDIDGEYPPESNWECGVCVDKDAFKCELIID